MAKVVARLADGRMAKGMTMDFSVAKDTLHVVETGSGEEWNRTEVHMDDLKALFFVRSLEGDPQHSDKKAFDSPPAAWEHRVEVMFSDGEFMLGTTDRYRPESRGFFLVPADAESNNQRCYVVKAATTEIRFLS